LELALEESNRNSNKPWSLSVSCGLIAYDPSFPTDIQTLLQMADAAMYRDKNARHSKAASEGACLVADRNPPEES